MGMNAVDKGRRHEQPLRYDRRLGRGRSARGGAAARVVLADRQQADVTAAGRPTTAVLVVPLWERPRVGERPRAGELPRVEVCR